MAAIVTCEITKPYPDRQTEGIVTLNTEFSQMADPHFDPSKSLEDDEIAVMRMLERLIKIGKVVDTESLCIIAGEKVWSIRIDVRILNNEGNVLDCACIAAMAALKNFKRPEVSVSGEEVTVYSVEEKNPVPLAILYIPVCISFACFNIDDLEILLMDPSLLEEKIAAGSMTICINSHKEICAISKPGGVELSSDAFLQSCKLAALEAYKIIEILNSHSK